MATKVGGVYIELAARLAVLEKDLRRAVNLTDRNGRKMAASFDVFERRIASVSAGFSRFTGLLSGGLALGGITALAKRALDSADNINTLAERVGISAERLQELTFAATQYGATQEDLNSGLEAFAASFGKFLQDGTGPGAKAFKALGIEATTTDEALSEFVDKLARVESQEAQAALASQAFGRTIGVKLVPLLRQGTSGLAALAKEARAAGLVISNDAVAAADEANDKLDKLKRIIDAQFVRAVAELAPDISAVVDALASNPEGLRQTGKALFQIAVGLGKVAQVGTTIVGTTGFIGDSLAAEVGGPALDDLVRLNDQIARYEALLTHSAPGSRTGLFPGLGFELSLTDEEIDAQLAKLRETLRLAEDLAVANLPAPSATAGDTDQSPFIPADFTADEKTAAAALKLAAAIEEKVKAYEAEAAAIGLTRVQVELKALAESGADSAQQERAARALQAIEIQEQTTAAIAETVGWIEALDAAEREQLQANEELAQSYRDLIDPTAQYQRQLEEIERLVAAGALNPLEGLQAQLEVQAQLDALLVKFQETQAQATLLDAIAEDVGATIAQGFEDAVLEGERLSDVLQGLYDDLLKLVFRKAITEPLAAGIADAISPNAQGNAFAGGEIMPFAKGGMVKRPTLFPMAKGAGLMGEAGPEAIMPLSRASNGDLGVKAEGLGGGAETRVIINNYSGERATAKQQSGQGGEDIVVTIGRAVAADIANNGPGARAMQGAYGLNRALVRR